MFARVSSYDGPAGLSDEEVEQITKRTLDHLAKLESDDGGSAQAPPTAGVEPVVDRLANVLREAETSARALREDAPPRVGPRGGGGPPGSVGHRGGSQDQSLARAAAGDQGPAKVQGCG